MRNRAVQLLKQTSPAAQGASRPPSMPSSAFPGALESKPSRRAWPRNQARRAHPARSTDGLREARLRRSRRSAQPRPRPSRPGRRFRFSKLIAGACARRAWGAPRAASSPKDRQIFANVMLGKARPWLMNISMADMNPPRRKKLITPALLESCQQAPIFTQIWVLRVDLRCG